MNEFGQLENLIDSASESETGIAPPCEETQDVVRLGFCIHLGLRYLGCGQATHT